MSRLSYEQFRLPALLRERSVDAIVLLGGFKVFGARCPQISVWQNAHLWTPGGREHSLWLRSYIASQRSVMRLTMARVAGNVFLSEDSATRCRESLRHLDLPVEIIPIALDPSFHRQPRPPALEDRDFLALVVGDIYPHKRFELAIEAMLHLHQRPAPIRLEIAGRIIDQDYYRRLERLVRRCNLDERVRFLGHLSREELIHAYRASRVFVSTSRLETFGLTPIEAMSSGLPVIACRDSAVPEVCGAAASYVDSEANALARAIDRVLDDSDEWRRLQANGLERAQIFRWELVGERYATLLEFVLDVPNPRIV